ncbi:MAG: cell division protein FtsX [Myxococcota bacterium]
MIQGATDIFLEHLSETAGVVGILVLALIIPAVLLLVVDVGADVIETRMSAYRPVVYLDASASVEDVEALRQEIDNWTGVDSVERREPADAYELMRERLGDREVAELGLSPSMFPYSLVVEPQNPVLGRIELIARVSGLEARGKVDSVDVPEGRAKRALDFFFWMLVGTGVLIAGCVVLATGHLRAYVLSLMRRQYAEWRLLVSFGASPREFRRVNMVRGVSLGAMGGVVSFGVLLGMLVLWRSYQADLVGVTTSGSVSTWFVIVAPAIIGPMLGWTAGVFANRKRLTEESGVDALGITHLLERHG